MQHCHLTCKSERQAFCKVVWLLLSSEYPLHFTWSCGTVKVMSASIFFLERKSILVTSASERALCCPLIYLDILKSTLKNGKLSFHHRIFIVNKKLKHLASPCCPKEVYQRTPELMQVSFRGVEEVWLKCE